MISSQWTAFALAATRCMVFTIYWRTNSAGMKVFRSPAWRFWTEALLGRPDHTKEAWQQGAVLVLIVLVCMRKCVARRTVNDNGRQVLFAVSTFYRDHTYCKVAERCNLAKRWWAVRRKPGQTLVTYPSAAFEQLIKIDRRYILNCRT